MEELFTLAEDVEFVAVADIDATTRQSFEYNENDVVITHRNTRTRSKVLSKDASAFLKNFSRPQSLAAAILHHAQITLQDPQQLAEDVFPLLLELQAEGFLVTTQEQAQNGSKRFTPGQKFLQYTILEVCQVTGDSSVFRVAATEGEQFALKVFWTGAGVEEPTGYRNEKDLLEKLDGKINPRLTASGWHENGYFLVLEWCSGMDCENFASRFRNYNLKQNLLQVVDACIQILLSFHHLHQQGFLHGDVHPNNILINQNGTVKILDYGASVATGGCQQPVRIGLDFYYEPEAAAALLNNTELPPITFGSELYSLAALLYHLIAGHHYLPFSLEPEKAYRQILEESPLPFSTFDLQLPACFDETFAIALAKEPTERFPSPDVFIQALMRCRKEVEASPAYFVQGKKDPEQGFLRMLTRKFGCEGHFVKNSLAVPPLSSVNYGAAGIAYLFYRMAVVSEKPEFLALADVWCNRAATGAEEYQQRFHTADKQISDLSVSRNALYHSPTGVHLVQALVSSGKGDGFALSKAVNAYLQAADVPCQILDVATGKAGLLIGSSLLLGEVKNNPRIGTTLLRNFTSRTMREIWQQLDGYPTMHKANPVDHFGLAHGWAGQIYAAVRWCLASGESLPANLTARIAELQTAAIVQTDTLRWPVALSASETWPGWCSGNAGYVLLWSLLFDYFKDERFLALAEQSGHALFGDRHPVPDLCCGLAGQAYAFNRLHLLTGKPVYRKKLRQIRQAIHDQLSSASLRNNSLYKGEVGIGVLFAELQRPELARMPLVE